MTVFEKKAALRPACLAVRKNIPPAVRAAADAALCRHVAALPAFAEADLLLLYAPVRGEPSLLPLLARAKEAGIPVAFPRCMGVQMHFHPVSDPNEMLPDRFGIPAPAADAPIVKATSKTLCILPGLAAGRDGTRLGYGGGFYDRFLATFAGITVFPIYECLLYPTLPTEETDRRVDHLITEKGEIPLHV